MAFFKKKKLSDGKWHAMAVNLQNPATIDDVADLLSARSTVSRADTYAVLVELGDVLGELMASGRSVKLKGVGSFYLTCQTRGKPRIQPGAARTNHRTDHDRQVSGMDRSGGQAGRQDSTTVKTRTKSV